MPWKTCPFCGGLSYSAMTLYDRWPCPYCGRELKLVADTEPPAEAPKRLQAISGT